MSFRKGRSGRVSLSMNCSPANWHWRWCARTPSSRRRSKCRRWSHPPQDHRRPALCADAIQQQATAAIADDLTKPLRMLRLLQGDVGSGKTVVALLAAAAVAEVGKQAALMAPTEILGAPASSRPSRRWPNAQACASPSSPAARKAASARISWHGLPPARSTSSSAHMH